VYITGFQHAAVPAEGIGRDVDDPHDLRAGTKRDCVVSGGKGVRFSHRNNIRKKQITNYKIQTKNKKPLFNRGAFSKQIRQLIVDYTNTD